MEGFFLMEKEIELHNNKCEVCSKQEKYGLKLNFTIWNDVCDDCFLKLAKELAETKLKKEGSFDE